MKKANEVHGSAGGRVFNVIGIVLCVILIPILIFNCTLIVKSYINKNEVPNFAGVGVLIVLSDSMYPAFKSGDMIITQKTDPSDIKQGDIIAFFDPNNDSAVVSHRVTEVAVGEDGAPRFRTRGDANDSEDQAEVPGDKLIGRIVGSVPGLGSVAMFLQTTPGMIVCVVVPLALLVLYDVLRRRHFYRKQKVSESELMAELEELRAQKAAGTLGVSQTSEPSETLADTDMEAETDAAPETDIKTQSETQSETEMETQTEAQTGLQGEARRRTRRRTRERAYEDAAPDNTGRTDDHTSDDIKQ